MAVDTMRTALRQIDRLFTDGVRAGLSDAQLLERFLSQKDDGAFELLVGRHGPMVLSVCRSVLRDPRDAEDAFQATFLVLVKKGGSIRGGDSLGGWLHRVAHRVSIQAHAAAARRRRLERQVGQMAVVASPTSQVAWDDVLQALHEEIVSLPTKYRLAIVLCDLEGMTQAQAAGQLHWSERTIRTRLAEGRSRLKRRLVRRGLAPDDAMLGAVLLREAGTVVPAALHETTLKAAVQLLFRAVAGGMVSMAAHSLARKVAKTMMIQQILLVSVFLVAVGVIAWSASTVLNLGGDEPSKAGAQAADANSETLAHEAGHEQDPLDATGTLPVSGRVLDLEGNPVASAIIYVYHFNMSRGDPGIVGSDVQSGRVAATAVDGRFQFQLDKASSKWITYDQPAWHGATIVAVAATGFGPAWVTAGKLPASGEVTLRLARDDVPIDGRIIDLEGRAVPGATVRLVEMDTPLQGDLNPWIAGVEALEADINSRTAFFNSWLEVEATGLKSALAAGPDGRFRLTGVGRERVVKIRIEGPTIETQDVFVMTRAHHRLRVPFGKGMVGKKETTSYICYGAAFDHVARPTRPIVGVVRDQDSGQPLPGVKVESCRFADFNMSNHNIIQAVTNAEGKYRLVGMPNGRGNIIMLTPRADQPYLPTLKEVDDRVGLEPVTADVALKRGIWIKGRVIDQASGRPVRGLVHYYARAANPHLAKVSGFKEADAWTRFSTSEDGSFRVVGLPGPGLVGAIAFEHVRYQPTERVGQSTVRTLVDTLPGPVLLSSYHALAEINPSSRTQELNCDLVAIPSNRLEGRVLDPDGKPLAGARVAGLDIVGSFWRHLTESSAFTVRRLKFGQPRRLLFLHEGRDLAGTIALRGDEKEPLSIRLQPAGSVTGRLVDADGEPLARIQLEAFVSHEDLDGLRALPQSVVTDNEGRFRLKGLAPGLNYDAGIDSGREGLTGFAFKSKSVRAGETRDLGDVRAESPERRVPE